MVTPSSIACEAPWTEVGRKGCAASPINAIRACFEIHYDLSTFPRGNSRGTLGGRGMGLQLGGDLDRRVSSLDRRVCFVYNVRQH